MSVVNTANRSGEYLVREASDADVAAFLSLYRDVWDCDRDREWFEWRFQSTPWADGARIAVAERDGRVVGAEACLPYPLRVGDHRLLAYQPVDWIVHPDHRRNGLCRRMTRFRIEADRDADCYFNFPTPPLRPLLADMGWRQVCRPTTYYRITDPATVARSLDRSPALATLSGLTKPFVDGYLELCDRRHRGTPGVSIESADGAPATVLARLYHEQVPAAIHVPRTEPYYRWRFANPRWETTTYVARRGGDPVAALVACVEQTGGVRTVRLADRLPFGPDAPTDALAALLRTAIREHGDAGVVKTTGRTIPPDLLERCGFVGDDAVFLRRFATPTVHVVRPLGTHADRWRVEGARLDDPDDWLVPLAAQDIA